MNEAAARKPSPPGALPSQCQTFSFPPLPHWVPIRIRAVSEYALVASLPLHWAVPHEGRAKMSSWGPQYSTDSPRHVLDRTGWGQETD